MRVLILGFGELARDVISRIKHFPEYGYHKGIYIYHVQTKRNTLSYPRDLIVEIPDPHGDGYRTYKDGLQALDDYSTTVSNYIPWLIDEARTGSFHIVIDCTPGDEESDQMIETLKLECKNDLIVLSPNKDGEIDTTINRLRGLIDGGKPWEPVEISQDILEEAEAAWKIAQDTMPKLHRKNKEHNIEHRGDPNAMSTQGYNTFSVISPDDRDLIDRFIINTDPKDYGNRVETYDIDNDCLVIEHEMLNYFFGWLPGEYCAAIAFLIPDIEIESAKYVKYLSNSSTHLLVEDSEYVIEYVHRGDMSILSTDGSRWETLDGDRENTSFAYMPKVNPPKDVKVTKNLETIIFTYRRTKS